MKQKLKIFFLTLTSSILILIFIFIISLLYIEKNTKLNIHHSLNNIKLLTHKGLEIKDINISGKPLLMFFGFTHCPEVCPTTLIKLEKILKDVNHGNKIKIIFVTLDPERDTVNNMGDYLDEFDELVIGLTGDIKEISRFAKKWNVFWEKINYDKNDYNINHTSTVFMIDKKGEFSGTISWGENEKSIILKIKKLLAH